MMRFPSSKDDRHTVRFAVDWTLVECDWLRKAGKLWARDTLPRRQALAPAIGALRHVSDALKGSPGYHDRQRLGLGDITAIAQHISTLNVGESTMVYSKSSQYLRTFRVILRHCRDAGYLADVPTPFAFMKMHEVKKPKSSGDEPGRAIPDSIIELLDANLATFTPNYPSSHRLSGWSNDDYGLMWQTIYVVLRDSGRRPGEITNLRYDCLTAASDDEPILKWDNQKAKRPGRRLPIFTTTARAIQAWQQRLRELTPTVKGRQPLFPSPSTRAEELNRPTQATYFGTKFGTWVDSIATLEQHLADLAHRGTPFSRAEIVLYGFRHAYAQSLADAGTQPDVLRQLMDHVSGETTSGYYRIGQKRKRDAIDVMSKLRSDIYGKNRPIGDLETYQRTEVATILGGCSEPANVKAGGKSCPIRFQCGGCSFYRPDPTYVPEIEDEIKRLRKDIATAELCATRRVVENLEYNLGMLQAVLRKMRDNLAALTPAEQAVYEVFHAEARKSRRLLRLNLTVAEPSAAAR